MKKNMHTSIGVLIVTGLLASTAISCTDGKGEAAKVVRKADPIPVRVLELESTEQAASVLTSGKITTDNEAILSFKIGGVIDQVFVQEGDRIREGQVLASINPKEINAVVAQARLLLEKSQRDLQRLENLYRDSVATLEQLENARTAFNVTQEQLQAANFNKEYSKVVALQDGFVLKKFVNPGQVVGIGDPVLKVNGISNNGWILEVNATDKEWSAIKVDNPATVKLDAFGDRAFNAKVLRKSEISDPATGTFTIDLLINNGGEKLASGMFGMAEISTGRITKVWSVPYEAVLDANGDEGYIFVTPDFKTAVKVPVTIASMGTDKISITSGFENFSALIVSGSAYLNDGSEITIIK